MVQYAIPKRVGLDDIKDILKGYYVEGAHDEPVSTRAVEDTTQLSDKVGRQTDFFVEIGVLEKSGRERLLTGAGEEIAEALMGGGEEQAKVRMRELLLDWDFTSKVQGFVRMQGPVEEDQLIEYITANAESDDDRGKNTLIDLFLWADILDESEEGLYSVSKTKPPEPEELEQEQRTEDRDKPTDKDEKPGGTYDERPPGTSGESGIDIEFSFTADDDPEEVKNVITAAREALKADLEDSGDTSKD